MMKKAKHKFNQNPENKIQSQKNPPARGDTTNFDERNSDPDDKKQDSRKGSGDDTKLTSEISYEVLRSSKGRTISQYQGINNLDALVDKSTKIQAKAMKNTEKMNKVSSITKNIKKSRQPKQRVGNNSKSQTKEVSQVPPDQSIF